MKKLVITYNDNRIFKTDIPCSPELANLQSQFAFKNMVSHFLTNHPEMLENVQTMYIANEPDDTLTDLQKQDLIHNTALLFLINEVSMQIVSKIADTKFRQAYKKLFSQTYDPIRRFTKVIREGLVALDRDKGVEQGTYEYYFDADMEWFSDQIFHTMNELRCRQITHE